MKKLTVNEQEELFAQDCKLITCDKCNDRGWDYIVYDKRTSFKGKGV